MLKEIDRWLLDFSNQYVKSEQKSSLVLMSQKIKEMQECHSKFQKLADEAKQKCAELNAKQSRIVRAPVATASPSQVILMSVVVTCIKLF